MQNDGSVYKEIFDFYNVQFHTNQEKQTARKFIRERLKKEFPQYNWSDSSNWDRLSVVEKNHFKLSTVREYFTERSLSGKEEIKHKVEAEMKDKLVDARIKLKEHNEYARRMFQVFYDEDATDEENHKLYEEFCSYLPLYTMSTATPTYDQFLKGPKRLYDYYQSEMSEVYSYTPDEDDSYEPIPYTTADVDHVALRSIIAYLEKKLSIRVDYDGIRDCLSVCNSCPVEGTATFTEDEESLKFFVSKKRLEDLDFVEKV